MAPSLVWAALLFTPLGWDAYLTQLVGSVFFLSYCMLEFYLIVTFRVARLTLQTRKLWLVGWLVGRCRDRPSRALPLTCPNVKNLRKKQKKRNKK